MSLSVWSLILYGSLAAIIYTYTPVKYRSIYLTSTSLIIYSLWAGLYALVIFSADIVLCLLIIRRIGTSSGYIRKIWLVVGIGIVLTFLSFFKYKDFWIRNESMISRIMMPLGISYYSFKIISYMIDTYKRTTLRYNNVDFLVYVTLFPQVICGPISRADEILNHIDSSVTMDDIKDGVYLILQGLFYKIVIADRLSTYTSSVFGNFAGYSFPALWLSVIFNAIELYCDFAGYSYIVTGICRFFAFEVRDNFRYPYFSKSIREFWGRWHISFSNWTRDYIYIPLGGNRKGRLRKDINILIVYFISGLWHGNTFMYAIWGLWHGIWNILSPRKIKGRFMQILCMIGTFLIFAIGQITFRIENTSALKLFLVKMLGIRWITMDMIVESVMPFSNDYSSVAKFMVAIILIVFLFIFEYRDSRGIEKNKIIRSCIYISSIVLFGVVSQSNFIYANY